MWKDIERISGVPFSRSASASSVQGQGDHSSLLATATGTDDECDINARRFESLRNALDKEKETYSSIQIELNTTKIALLDATSRANDLEETNNLLQETVDALRAENDTKSLDLLQMTASDANKGTRIEQLCDQVKDLETQLYDLANSNETLMEKHTATCDALKSSKQQNIEHETKIDRLETRLSDVTKRHVKDKQSAQVELKQVRMILQTKLEHALEQLKESEAREQMAIEAKSKAADEVPKLMAQFKAEREAIRAEMTKVGVHILRCDLPYFE